MAHLIQFSLAGPRHAYGEQGFGELKVVRVKKVLILIVAMETSMDGVAYHPRKVRMEWMSAHVTGKSCQTAIHIQTVIREFIFF